MQIPTAATSGGASITNSAANLHIAENKSARKQRPSSNHIMLKTRVLHGFTGGAAPHVFEASPLAGDFKAVTSLGSRCRSQKRITTKRGLSASVYRDNLLRPVLANPRTVLTSSRPAHCQKPSNLQHSPYEYLPEESSQEVLHSQTQR